MAAKAGGVCISVISAWRMAAMKNNGRRQPAYQPAKSSWRKQRMKAKRNIEEA